MSTEPLDDLPTTLLPVYKGSDLERLAELRRDAENKRRAADHADRSGPRRTGDEIPGSKLDQDAAEAEAAYDSFVAEAAERATGVRLVALDRKAFRKLVLGHPPRRVTDEETNREVDHPDDQPFGLNVETFPEALLKYREGDDPDDQRTITEPAFETAAKLGRFVDRLTEGYFERFWLTAYGLNTSHGGDPKELAYSPARASGTAT